jgi:hypothetical protein
MVNVRAAANVLTSAVNPNISATARICTGYTTDTDGTQLPSYAKAVPLTIQAQEMTYKDVQHAASLNIQRIDRAVYSNIQLKGVDRKTQQGGDLVTFTEPQTGERSVWLVAVVFEGWTTAGWSKVGLVKQLDDPNA